MPFLVFARNDDANTLTCAYESKTPGPVAPVPLESSSPPAWNSKGFQEPRMRFAARCSFLTSSGAVRGGDLGRLSPIRAGRVAFDLERINPKNKGGKLQRT